MGIPSLILIAVSLAAAPPPPPAQLAVWAVQATVESRDDLKFGAGLDEIRGELSGLQFNTFKLLTAGRFAAPFGQETRTALHPRYSLVATPVSREEDGRIRIDLRVEMPPRAPGGKPVVAVQTRVMMAPGTRVKLGGLRLEEGDLVVVLETR